MQGWVVLYNPHDMVYQAITGPEPIPKRRLFRRTVNAAITVFQLWMWIKHF